MQPQGTRKIPFTAFYQNRCQPFRRSVPLSTLNDTGKHEGQGNISFSKPQGFRTIRFHLAAEAIEWLDGTTKDDDDNAIGNHTLFYNLLSRMRLIPGRRFIPQAAGATGRTVAVLGNRTCGRMAHGEEKSPQPVRHDGEAGSDSGKQHQSRFRGLRDLHRGWTDRQGSYVGNPYHTAPNGI